MALEKFNWQNGSLIEPAKVNIEGVSYDVVEAQFEGETPLSASNLNLMQDTILGNVKDDLEDDTKIPSAKAVMDIHSETETKTNKVWIDNKPIYKKVISIPKSTFGSGTASSGSSFHVAHDISNIDITTDIKIFWKDNLQSQNRIRFIPSSYFSSLDWSAQVVGTPTEIHIEIGKEVINRIRSSMVYMYAIIEYTKTTD